MPIRRNYDGGYLVIALYGTSADAPAKEITALEFALTKQGAGLLGGPLENIKDKTSPGEIKAALVNAFNGVQDIRFLASLPELTEHDTELDELEEASLEQPEPTEHGTQFEKREDKQGSLEQPEPTDVGAGDQQTEAPPVTQAPGVPTPAPAEEIDDLIDHDQEAKDAAAAGGPDVAQTEAGA
jgi:hypothetical protein